MAWDENLLDGLLNFAATPKGLLLLQRTDAITECVTFMFNRHAKKLQVWIAICHRQKEFVFALKAIKNTVLSSVHEEVIKPELNKKPYIFLGNLIIFLGKH